MISRQERQKGFEKSLYIKPQEAFRKLKLAEALQQHVFISASVGFGKTSLINAYFGMQPIYYISAKHIGEDLRLVEKKMDEAALAAGREHADGRNTAASPELSKKTLVIDDLQYLSMLDADPEEREQVLHILEREDLRILLVSRGKIPRWLMSSLMRKPFVMIGEPELRPDIKAVKALYKKNGLELTEENVRNLLELCEYSGHALMHSVSAAANGAQLTESTINELRLRYFEYLEHEVYEQWDASLYNFILKMSIVDSFTIPLAQMITGRSDAEEIVRRAEEIGSFLRVEYLGDTHAETVTSVYSLRESTRFSHKQILLRQYSTAQIANLYCNAGIYHELSGDSETAIKMYMEAGAEERIISLLEENVRRAPEVSNYYQLRNHYLALPEETIRNSIILMAGLSMLYALLLNVEKSEYWYGELCRAADTAEGAEKRQAVSMLSYLDMALPQRTIEQMPEIYHRITVLIAERKIDISTVSVTSSLPSLVNGAKDLLTIAGKPELFQKLAKEARPIMGTKVNGLWELAEAESLFYCKADIYRSLELQIKGRMEAERESNYELLFVSVALSVWSSLLEGNISDAYAHCKSFEEKIGLKNLPLIKKNLYAVQIYLDLYRGELSNAEEWLKTTDEHVEFITYYRIQYLIKCRVYIALGRLQEAMALLKQLQYFAQVLSRHLVRIECELLLAIVTYRLHQPEWEEILKKSLRDAEHYHLVRLITKDGAALMPLLKASGWITRKASFVQTVREELARVDKLYPKYLEDAAAAPVLSENALAILRLQSAGKKVNEIADALSIQPETVKYHNNQTYKKLGVKGKAAAILEARRRGIIE